MAQTSFALMTNLGRAKEAAALANATAIEITHIAIGDGVTVPSGGETALYNEVARKTISGHGTVIGASNVAYFDCYLAAGDGPYTIREAGLYDVEGDLIAIAHYNPPINKPVPESGQTVEGTVRLEVAFSNIATVIIAVDPSMQVALQRLTRLPWVPIISMSLATPPVSPAPGDTYLIAASPTGAWTGQAGKIAEFTIAGWAIITPPDGHGISLPDGRVFERIGGSYVEKIALDAQSGKWIYAEDSGTADALAVALTPVPTVYATGMVVHVKKSASANATTTPTLNVNSLGARIIINADGSAVRAGDLPAGVLLTLGYDGSAFRIISFLPSLLSGNSPFSATYSNRFSRSAASISVPHGAQTAVPFDASIIGADANCVLSSGACKILKAGRYIMFSGASINFIGTKPEGTYCAGIYRNGSLQANGSGILCIPTGVLANFEATSFYMADLNVDDLIQVSVYQFNAGSATLTPICSSSLNILRVT